jgi:hypothetical protein
MNMNNYFVNDINESSDLDDSIIMTLMTIIVGLLIGSIIGYFIFRDIKYVGPDSNEIVKETYTDSEGRKYKYKPKITICPINYSMGKLHDPKFKESH